jgi:phospholipid transport system substrate-binding protein
MLSTLGIAISLLLTASVHAEPGVAGQHQTVVDLFDRTIAALEDRMISDAEADTLLELIDVDRVAEFTLGRHGRSIADADRTEFYQAFREFLKADMRKHLSSINLNEYAIVRSDQHFSGDTIVTTQVSTDGTEVEVLRWRLDDSGEPRVIDIEFRGLWFAIEQRAQFHVLLGKSNGDITALAKHLTSRS